LVFWHWITESWRPLDSHFKQFLSGNRAAATGINSTLQTYQDNWRLPQV